MSMLSGGNMDKDDLIKNLKQDLDGITLYLNDFLAFLPSPICELTPRGMISNVNKSFEKFSGFEIGDLLGQNLSKLFFNSTKIENILKRAEDEQIVRNEKALFINKEKKRITVLVTCGIRKNTEEELTGFFVSMTDISEMEEIQGNIEQTIKQRTEELQKSRKALLNILEDTEAAKNEAETQRNKAETIFDNFFDGLIILDSDYQIESVNPAAERFLGIKEEDYLAKSPSALAKNKELKEFVKIVSRKEKEVYRKETIRGGLVLEVTTKFISFEEKRVFTLIILHDITREKTVERLKSQFVSVAAHQLRTPLSIIKWSLAMLLDGEVGLLTKEQIEMIDKAQQTNERMIHLINDLLNVARIEEGRFVYHPKTVDLIELLDKVLEPVKVLADNKKIELEFKKPKDKRSKIIKADIEKLSLAIKNLLENAVHYTNSGGKVILCAKRNKDKMVISVKDTGIGIPKDQQEQVFSKFFRADNAVRTETEGTGLGLFITKNIIEAHEGEIRFESEENKGTTFTFTLPVIG